VAAFFPTDVTSWKSQTALFSFSYSTFGPRIDYVFANAGIAQMKEMRSKDPSYFGSAAPTDLTNLADHPPVLKVIDVNLTGVLYTVQLSLVYFRRQNKDKDGWRGKIVATASNAAIYPFPNDPLYGAAKMGVLGTVRALGPKVFKEGITVNCFGPSVVATGLGPPDFLEKLEKDGRMTPMLTITKAVDMFIDPSSKLTGQMIENCVERNVIRPRPPYMDAKARANMDEFWPVDEIDETLDVDLTKYEVV